MSRFVLIIAIACFATTCHANAYDHRDRVVQTVAMNHLGGIDRRSTAYDFAGRPIGSTIEHSTAAMADSTVVQRWRHSFDRHGRELSASLRLGPGQWQAISGKEYDAVGRLGSETIGEPDRHICRTYAYDIRSNPVSVSSYGYRQKLSFTPGGNISRMTWWAYGPNETERTYEFTYDALARLTSAGYSDANGKRGLFDTSYSYDLNGNITALRRSGLYDTSYYGDRYGLVDDLTYSYSGNQVTAIADACAGPFYYGAYHFADGADLDVEYTYDANGNMTADLNRGITSMAYDLNNRPSAIEFSSGASVSYIYDADGRKLRTIRSIPSTPPAVAMESVDGGEAETTVTDYCGDYIYEDGAIERINTPAGYLSFRDNYGDRLDTPRHIFFLRDHLGNNRVALDGANGAIMQINHYYPFGMPMNAGYNTGFQPWKFGGKEFDRTAGLDLYDFEARAYDPSTARFLRHDDLTEKYLPLSPYTYCANNPLILIDKDGKQPLVFPGNLPPIFMTSSNPLLISSSEPIVTAGRVSNATKYIPKTEKHHLIPRQLKGEQLVEQAIKEGFKFEGTQNKIDVPKFSKAANAGRHGNHPKYTEAIKTKLQRATSSESALEKVVRIADEARKTIENNPTKKINDIRLQTVAPIDNLRVVNIQIIPISIKPTKK